MVVEDDFVILMELGPPSSTPNSSGAVLWKRRDEAGYCLDAHGCCRPVAKEPPEMISDPIEFELFKNSLLSIAYEMALTIFRTTYSGVLQSNMDYSPTRFYWYGSFAAHALT